MIEIGTSSNSLRAQNFYTKATDKLNSNLARLSSGSGLITDDPSGHALSENMRVQTRTNNAITKNLTDAVSVVDTAKVGISEILKLLNQMKEITLKAGSTLNSEEIRTQLDSEFNQYRQEIDRIAKTTQFNGVHLFNGSVKELPFQVGGNNDATSTIMIKISDFRVDLEGLFPLKLTKIKDEAYAKTTLDLLDTHIQRLQAMLSKLGGYQERFQSALSTIENETIETQSRQARIGDVDLAFETAELAKHQIGRNAAEKFLVHTMNDPKRVMRLV